MSNEIKMSKLFPKVFEVNHNKSFEVQNCHWVTFGEDFHSNCEQDYAIEHAVLNHDRLVEENERLRLDLLFLARSKQNSPVDSHYALDALVSMAARTLKELEDNN